MLDAFSAISSQEKCGQGYCRRCNFKDEIVPVVIKGKKGDTVIVDTDEGPRPELHCGSSG